MNNDNLIDFEKDIDTYGDDEDYRKLNVDEYDRFDGRTVDELMKNIENSNKEEDHHVAHITQLHNAAKLGSMISTAGLGAREKYIENVADIPNKGDHTWFFHEEKPFNLNIELKTRNFGGSDFRPKYQDVINCIMRNIPYLLIQNANKLEATIILLRMEDILFIQDLYSVIAYEIKYGKPWNPYQEDKTIPKEKWKKYYKCNVFDCVERFENRKISYQNLKRNGSYDEWMKVIEYFRLVSGKQG